MNKVANRLEQLEAEIESGCGEIAKALTAIRDGKLYVDGYGTFEAYCKQRWNFTDRHARNLIDAEQVRAKIGTIVPVRGLNSLQLLEIGKAPVKQQAQIAAEVIEQCEAENRKPTAKDFKKKVGPVEAKPKPEPKPPKEKVFKADAKMREMYVDAENNEVPESLYPVWRDVAAFHTIHTILRDAAAKVQIMEHGPGGDFLDGEGDQLLALAEVIFASRPYLVSGDEWSCAR